jgi:hypothetical protein
MYHFNNIFGNSLKTYDITSWWCWMHSFNFAWNSQCATVWTRLYCCPWWGVICCGVISDMAAFNFSNWAQATAVRVINRDGKPIPKPDSNNDEKHCKEINNYNAVIWFSSCHGGLHKLRKYLLFFMVNFSRYHKCISFMERKWTTIRIRRGVLWLIEFGMALAWNGPAWRLFLIYFLSSCF